MSTNINAKTSTQLNCFSPPVMIATIVIEVISALYTLVRYKMNELTRLAALTLLMLATFQLCEFMVCTGKAGHIIGWSRVGFAAITVLPPLGLHIFHVLADRPRRGLIKLAYATMAGFIVLFLAFPDVFNSYQCGGNYVIFHLKQHLGGVYWIYYGGWILISIGLAIKWLYGYGSHVTSKADRRRIQAIQGLIVGWLIFIVPTATVNILKPSTTAGIPSIMCGFAVLFALILTLYILPRTAQPRSRN